MRDLNPRPLPCKGSTLPTELIALFCKRAKARVQPDAGRVPAQHSLLVNIVTKHRVGVRPCRGNFAEATRIGEMAPTVDRR